MTRAASFPTWLSGFEFNDTVNGAAFTGSGEFAGAILEPATMLLLGTGLTGIVIKLRKQFKKAQQNVAQH